MNLVTFLVLTLMSFDLCDLRLEFVRQEIIDQREAEDYFHKPSEILQDFTVVANRYGELLDCPYAWESERFGTKEYLQQQIDFYYSYRTTLIQNQKIFLYKWTIYQDLINETETLFTYYDKLRDIANPGYYINQKRIFLRELRKMIGDDAFYRGELPPPVPLWRFEQLQ